MLDLLGKALNRAYNGYLTQGMYRLPLSVSSILVGMSISWLTAILRAENNNVSAEALKALRNVLIVDADRTIGIVKDPETEENTQIIVAKRKVEAKKGAGRVYVDVAKFLYRVQASLFKDTKCELTRYFGSDVCDVLTGLAEGLDAVATRKKRSKSRAMQSLMLNDFADYINICVKNGGAGSKDDVVSWIDTRADVKLPSIQSLWNSCLGSKQNNERDISCIITGTNGAYDATVTCSGVGGFVGAGSVVKVRLTEGETPIVVLLTAGRVMDMYLVDF